MDETKASLADKLEALESQVTSTVQSATDVVTETVDSVKGTVENVTETVHETVHSVTQAFDLPRQFERHPWGMVGGSIAIGCLVGYLTAERKTKGTSNGTSASDTSRMTSRMAAASAAETTPRGLEHPWAQSPPSAPAAQKEEPAQHGWFYDELGRLKNLALGALMGAVRDLTVRSLPPSLGHKVAEEVDHLTSNLGAEPVRGPVLPEGK